MSVLEGGADHRKVFHIDNPFGKILDEVYAIKLNGAMDIAVNEAGDIAYIAGRNTLYIFNIEQPENPVLISEMTGIGSGRQIEVQNGIAYITSRPDGLFICDVKNPKQPSIITHYDTIELATGVWASGNLCFIACRHMGVEIIDISDPNNPVHLSNVLAGEVQSVFAESNYMYAGSWMHKEVVIFDISDPKNPVRLSTCPLDGFGDGVYVRDNICFAATGHHSRKFINRTKYLKYDFVTAEMLNDGYGAGHGLEIFDISDRKNPRFISQLKTPPLFMGGNDLWDVIVSGNHAYLADTYNGVFIINIEDLSKPFFEGYKRLGVLNNTNYFHQPPIQQLCNPVTGIVPVNGYLLAVSLNSGLHVLKADAKISDTKCIEPCTYSSCSHNEQTNDDIVFKVNGQVHALVFIDDYVVITAGDQGIYVLDYKNGYNIINHIKTAGFALDIKKSGRYLYVAEGSEGFSVWKFAEGSLHEVSRYKNETEYETVGQVVLFEKYGLAALHIGVNRVTFIDIHDPENISFKGASRSYGMMYYKRVAEGLFKGKYAAIQPLSDRTVWFDLSDNEKGIESQKGFERSLCPIEEGIALTNDFILTIFRGKYYISDNFNHVPSEDEMITVYTNDSAKYKEYASAAHVEVGYALPDGELYLSGWPYIIGNTLYVLNRQIGIVAVINIKDIKNPVFVDSFKLDGNPENIIFHDGAIWIPCGHGGLYRIKI